MNTIKVKKGDNVAVIAGKDKGKTGKVTSVFPKENRITISGVNVVSKHRKAKKQGEKAAIIKIEAPINASNVMLKCDACSKVTRIGYGEKEGKKVRLCKHCGASLDKAVKIAKNQTKKDETKAKVDTKKSEKVVKKTKDLTKTTTATETKKVSTTRKTAPKGK